MIVLKCTLSSRPTPQEWDLISGLLYQFHSQGIEEGEYPAPDGEKALTSSEFEIALEPGVLLPPEQFSAYFENHRDAERAWRSIENILEPYKPAYQIAEVEEKDYTELWKQHFTPVQIPPFWLIRAPWHEKIPSTHEVDGLKELIIEPGMAFGTGSHETTRSCLELIAEACAEARLGQNAQDTQDTKILDFGCGSGILSIALKKLHIGKVIAVDIDPLAIEATAQNSKMNQVEVESVLQLSPSQRSNFDGIVANILRNTLLEYAPSFHEWLKPGGFIILSGLLVEQEPDVLERYQNLGFNLKRKLLSNNWASLWMVKSD